MWAATVSGLQEGGSDSLEAIAIAPDSRVAYVTGTSAGVAEFDADFLTVAYRLQNGREEWRARYDGLGEHKSDRANGLAVAPDGNRVYVTGDSWSGPRDGRTQYDYATVAYNTVGGEELWTGRYGGPVAGFNSAIGVVATESRVVVTGQSRGESSDDVRDFGTVAYDADTGGEQWRHRYAPAHSDDIALRLALGDDVAYVTGGSSPTVPHTNLDETATVAYRVDDGTIEWVSQLDLKPDDALAPRAIAAGAGGGVVIAAQVTRSADLIQGPSSNVYDALIASY